MAPNYDRLLPLLPDAELLICCFKPVSVKLYLLTLWNINLKLLN
jgi:hypothetical protein